MGTVGDSFVVRQGKKTSPDDFVVQKGDLIGYRTGSMWYFVSIDDIFGEDITMSSGLAKTGTTVRNLFSQFDEVRMMSIEEVLRQANKANLSQL